MHGRGLLLTNYPTDEDKFRWIVAQEGCHPKAANRILTRIKENGHDKLTVMSALNFTWIQEQLATIGVKLSFIEPQPEWVNKYQDGTWPEEALPDKFKFKLN